MKPVSALLFTLLLSISGCEGIQKSDNSYQYFEMIDEEGWSSDKELFFSSSELKSDKQYNVILTLRLDRDISYKSIPIGITYETPMRELSTHVVQVPIKRAMNGNGGFNFFEQSIVIEEGAQYPLEGVYSYSLRHLSTDSIVDGIVEVGLKIEPIR